jgi:hypothetical protein
MFKPVFPQPLDLGEVPYRRVNHNYLLNEKKVFVSGASLSTNSREGGHEVLPHSDLEPLHEHLIKVEEDESGFGVVSPHQKVDDVGEEERELRRESYLGELGNSISLVHSSIKPAFVTAMRSLPCKSSSPPCSSRYPAAAV